MGEKYIAFPPSPCLCTYKWNIHSNKCCWSALQSQWVFRESMHTLNLWFICVVENLYDCLNTMFSWHNIELRSALHRRSQQTCTISTRYHYSGIWLGMHMYTYILSSRIIEIFTEAMQTAAIRYQQHSKVTRPFTTITTSLFILLPPICILLHLIPFPTPWLIFYMRAWRPSVSVV